MVAEQTIDVLIGGYLSADAASEDYRSVLDSGGHIEGAVVVAKDLKGPEGIALAPDGKLIVAEVGAKRIVSIDPASGAITEIAAKLPIGLPATPGGLPSNIPTGVGVGATGVIYFSSDIENAIYKVVRK